MAEAKPPVIIIGGPNGAGKTTIAPALLPETLGVVEYVNADVIARGLSGFNPDASAIAAAKIMLARVKELAESRAPFAFETTLASRSFAPWIADLRKQNAYQFFLAFVWVKSPDISIDRVATRVRHGGHFVPDDVVRRRYTRGLWNFFNLYMPIADRWYFYDNSVFNNGILVAEGSTLERADIFRSNIWESAKIAASR